MSIKSTTMSLSKEMSVEESYSKTSSVSSSSLMSSTLESKESLMTSGFGDSDSLLKLGDSSMSALVSKLDSDLGLGDAIGTKMSSLEKSSSLMQSEDSFSMKKAEISSSVDIQESSQSMSMKSVKEEVSMSKSESTSETMTKSLTKSESISSEVSEEKEVYVVIMDYSPRSGDAEGLTVREGQEVEVVDSSKAHKWRVKHRQSGAEGSVPSCYLEKKATATPPASPQLDPKAQAARARREKVLKELVESEEAFARDMQHVVNNHMKEMESKNMSKELRDCKDTLFTNFKAISEFHNNVLMKGIQYYADDPSRLGKTFLRLERDFDMHVSYCRDEPEAQQVLTGALKEHFDEFSKKIQDEKSLSDHLKLPIQRINDYQLLLKELIKYTTRLKESTEDLEKAHDFMQAIPQRIADLQYLNSIQGYKGNLHKLGRILKHDWFEVTDGNGLRRERFLFLFKSRIFVTDHKRVGSNRSIYLVKHIIKLPEVEIVDNADDDDLKMRFQSLRKGLSGFPLTVKAKTMDQKDEWLNVIQVAAGPQAVEDLGDEDLEIAAEEHAGKTDDGVERAEPKVEILEDFDAYEELHTVVTESVRSGSLTSLEDFHSALEDEASLCFTASEMESGGPGRPRFTAPLRAHTSAEGVAVILECEVCATPEATVAWLKDNSPLATSQRAILEAEGGKHRLVIKRSECSDSGLYTIIASNVHGTTSCSAPLTVSSAPDSLPPTAPDGSPMPYGPIFREKLRNTELQEGTDFRVCIIVEGEPQPQVKFYKNDKEITKTGRVRFNQEGRECFELIIDNVMTEDVGKYSCIATSSAGQNVTACDVKVTSPKVFFKFDEDPDKTSTPEILDSDLPWSKDAIGGKEIESSERFKVEIDDMEDTVALVFHNVTPGDAGMYTCVASTGSGKIKCSAELTVQGGLPRDPEAPKLTAASSVVEAKEGGSALLELSATGFPKPTITWTKDGEELKPGDKYMVLQEDDENITVAIKNVTPEDSGKYAAEAVNELGRDEVAYELKVTSSPKFTQPMKDMTASVDEDVEFSVVIDGSPTPTITWCKDGQPLKEGGRIEMTEDGKTRKLSIRKATPEDSGNYSCLVKNDSGSQGGFGALKVNSPAKFVKGLSDQVVESNEEAVFSVKVTGTPAPHVKWLKDGVEIGADDTYFVQRAEDDGSRTLRIKKSTSRDAGEYACEVSNCHGKDQTAATLSTREKPEFSKGLKPTTQWNEGDKDVDLTVNVTGSPAPAIKWYIDNMVVTETSNYKVMSDEKAKSFTLRVKEVTTDSGGTYKCEATNESGTTTTTTVVTVTEETKTVASKFKKTLTDTEIVEGKDVELTVEVEGSPKPSVKWSKDGKEVSEDVSHFESKRGDTEGSHKLLIHKAALEDAGSYTCTITNSAGSDKTSSKLTVKAEESSPTFRKELRDVSVKEGETVEFSVKFSGKPKPEAEWTKDGDTLTIDSKRFEYKKEEADDSLTLVLHDAKAADSGKYSCTLKSKAGSATTSSNVTVTVEEKSPSFTQGLKDQAVKEEESAEFTVKFEGKPKPTAKWNKDGAELTIDNKHLQLKCEEAGDSLTLILNKATKDDAGEYSCTITNTAGSKTTKSKLTVSETQETATFVKKLKDQTVTEEETLELTVKFTGKPKPTYKWSKDGADLKIDDEHFEIDDEEDTLTLIINDVTKEDAGKYTCNITNSSGSDTTSSTLSVNEQTNAPKFVKGLKDQSIKEEQTVRFTVKYSGKPKPTAKWSKDGADLKIDGSHVKLEEAEDSLTIVLQEATREDAGKYSCTISNSAGSDTTSSKLTVSENTSAPEFTQKLKDRDVKEGETVQLTVKFSGKPKPTAKWTFDEAELTLDDARMELRCEEDGASLTLVIRSATKDDAGKYGCTVANAHGSQGCSGRLTISAAPVFVKTLEDVEGDVGSPLRLNVKFEGAPEPVATWKRDGVALDIDGKHLKVTIESDDSLTLVIDKVALEDAGKYTCEIKNAQGTTSTSGKVVVTGKPNIKKGLAADKEVVDGESDVELVVEATGSPTPEGKWYRSGKQLVEDDTCSITSDETKGTYKLTIKKASSDAEGEYRFEASNSSGKAETKGKLTVLKKPAFTKDLQDQTLVEGDALKLEVAVVGSPEPKLTWHLGKKQLTAGDTYDIADSGRSLTVASCSPEDSGAYTCKAKNSVGEATQSATVTVKSKKDTQAPMFVTHLYDQVIVVGDAGRMEVKVTGKPQPEVTWYKKDEKISESDTAIIKSSVDDCTYSLTLKDLKIQDSASYKCKATNQYGSAEETSKLTVKEPVEPSIEELEDLQVRYGAPARIKAKIHGFPIPEVKWMRGDRVLKSKDDLYEITSESEHNRHAVSLKTVKEEEAGEYTCIASNSAGEAKKSCTLSIKPQAPVLAREMKDQSIDVGDDFAFDVEVYGYPTPEITWYKDNTPVEVGGRFKVSRGGDVARLEGRGAETGDVGVYSCKARNPAGEESSKATLKIQDFEPTIVDKLPSALDLTEGDKLQLKAKAAGQPTPELKWTKDGKSVKPSGRVRCSVSPDGTAQLDIDDVTHDDSGTYRLLATNDKGHAATESDVTVAFQEKAVKPFVGQLHPLELTVGKPLVLEAKVAGKPKPKISWCKDGESVGDVSSGARVRMSEAAEGKAALTIKAVKLEDAGEYKITASNAEGEDSSFAQVKVTVPGKKPVIVKELKATKLMEGEPGILEAVVSGSPMPAVTWMHNGKNVLEGKHCAASLDAEGRATLRFGAVACEDGGMYQLTAANKLGKAVSEAPVNVVPLVKQEAEKKPVKTFEFLQGLMPQLVAEGKACRLEARVTTDPKPISVKWTKDGKDIPPTERLETGHDGDGHLSLVIHHVTPADRGRYAVVAYDGQTEIKSEALVNMMPSMPGMSGNKPSFLKGLEPVTLQEGERLHLQALLPPDSGCVIRWMKDGEEVSPDDRTQLLQQPNGAVALVIEGATAKDSGKYVVVAHNVEGKTRSSAVVAVVGDGFKVPEILESLTPATFMEGEPGKLEAKVGGEPRPEVKWLHDGEQVKPDDRISVREQPDGRVTLDFKKVLPEDAGKYTVVIANVGGETRTAAPVQVNQPPLFSSPVQDAAGVEGYPTKLECKVSGNPAPQISWSKDGAPISPEDSNVQARQLPSGEVTLVFDKCRPEDAGSYSCSAKNPHGEKSCKADLKILGKEDGGASHSAPAFVTPLGDVTAKEGASFRLEGVVSGNPLPDVLWFLDHQPLSLSDTIVPAFDGKRVSLSVSNCNARHAGAYECKISNALGDASSRGSASITGNSPPTFVERLSDSNFSTNEPMQLVCRVEGVPEPDVEWFFDGSRVEPGLKYSPTKEGNKCLLSVPRPRSKDSGVYECRAKNAAGKDSCKASITVSGGDAEGEAPMFLKKLRDTSAINGMTTKLTACICGVPKPEIKWFKDGQQLSSDSRRTLEADPNGVIRLIVRGANKSDPGMYRVSISNMFGSDTCTANLDVEGPDKPMVELPTVRESVEKPTKPGPPSPLPHAPYIFKMTDNTASLGWRPSIPHYPQVPFTYRLEICRIPDGEWSTYKSGIRDSSCDIRDLAPGLDYRFRVRVENQFGASDPSPYVTAHRSKLHRPPTPGDYAPKDYEIDHEPLDKYAAAPRFLRREEEFAYAVRAHPARVEFWVYGCPTPKISWFYNNVEIEKGKYDFLEDRNGQVILFITRMGEDDVGSYTCKAVNEHGEATQKVKLLIAEAPIFLKRLDPTTVMIRKGGEFRCKVIGVPRPKVKWFKDWHPLSASGRIAIREQEPDSCSLTLDNSILKDGGLYTCTATNVAGAATSSAMLSVEECENEYHILTYRRPNFVKPSDRPFEDDYDIGDELGRGTQGVTFHAVERSSGRSFAAKVMRGGGKLLDLMSAEMDVMKQLCHPRLVRLWNAHATDHSVTLATDMCGGGELLPHILSRGQLTESSVALYVKQMLEGLQHMHEKNIAHLGLTLGDVLVTRLNSDHVKIGDFGLATRLYSGREYVPAHGHPEYVAPEVALKQPVTLAADMWSLGIISYILLVGESPFLRENDRETLKEVQKGKANLLHDGFVVLSDEARDFVTQLLQFDPSQRMDVNAALRHKWLEIADLPDKCDELNNIDRLRDYHKKWKSWYANASCRTLYRRRTLESCFTHPSRMIYPPDEKYSPSGSPDRQLDRSRIKPAAFDDVTYQQRIERENIDARSESQYQNGPDTFLLPLRDPDFPVRIRKYLKIGAARSPILARHLKDKHWGYSDVAVKERRKFVDVMDEEIRDEKKGLSRSAPLRMRHEVGTVGSEYDHAEARSQRKKRGFRMPAGTAPFFREKMKDAVIREEEETVFECRLTTTPEAQVSWFRNDGILIESSRIVMSKWSDGRCSLTLKPAKGYDVGVYKCVARNANGIAVCRARLNLGSVSGKPDPPKAEKCSDTEIFLTWLPPKSEGHSPIFGYTLEYKEKGAESWTKIANNVSHEFYLVRNLTPTATYHFRICAVNRFGWSDFSAPSEPIITLPEPAAKIELGRAEKFQQDQTDSGQELLLELPDQPKLDYEREEEPLELQEAEPTELYNYISEVAKGRFSLVMKVWHKKLNAAFVAKACHLTPQTEGAVRREFEVYKSLQHERIACLHSASISPTSLFLVMEKLSGMDVLSFLSSRPLYTEDTVSRIIHQVIDALEYLHFRGICYLELQPDNVVMVERHHLAIQLVDFGSAQYLPEEGTRLQVDGALEYLAPEVIKGEEVHSPVDIWSVGVLTYILLSGVSPFAGDSEAEVRDNVTYVRYHFDHLFKEVSQEATLFLMHLFKRTPQKRPTAAECLDHKWLLPNEYMIKKREHAVFLSHRLRHFSEQFHSAKAKSTPPPLLNIFGKAEARS